MISLLAARRTRTLLHSINGSLAIYKPPAACSRIGAEQRAKRTAMAYSSLHRGLLTGLALLSLNLVLPMAPCAHGKSKFSAVFMFGDSIVDPGNNNNRLTEARADFPPYGQDFPGGKATGRFSNGKVPGDMLGTYEYRTATLYLCCLCYFWPSSVLPLF